MNRALLYPALALALLAGSCGRPRPDKGPVVVSVIGADTRRADPSRAPLATPQRVVMGATAQGLVRFDANGGIEPGLAERWIVSDNGRSYIFRLRDAQWPDGSPVTAREVVATLRHAIANGSQNILAPFLVVVDEIVDMTPQVVEVRLRRSRPDLLKLFAQPELGVFRLRGLDGSGPFRVQPDRGGGTLLRPVPDEADTTDEESVEEPQPEQYVRLFGERAARALVRFAARQSDLVLGGTFADWPIVPLTPVAPGSIRTDPAVGLFGLAIVDRHGFLSEAPNRAAIAMALDRAGFTRSIRDDWAPVETLLPAQLDSSAPPALPAWTAMPPAQRLALARARVAQWRSANGNAPIHLRIALPEGPGATLLWGNIGARLIALGIEPELVPLHADADLRLIDEVAPYDSGRWYLEVACRLCSDNVATLVDAARDAPTLDARAHRIAEADAAVTADSAFIPIAQPLRWSIVSMRLRAWQGNPRAWHPLNHLRNADR